MGKPVQLSPYEKPYDLYRRARDESHDLTTFSFHTTPKALNVVICLPEFIAPLDSPLRRQQQYPPKFVGRLWGMDVYQDPELADGMLELRGGAHVYTADLREDKK